MLRDGENEKMFEKITPEEAGVSSSQVERFLSNMDKFGVTLHGVLMMKGDKIFCEAYKEPFGEEVPHRMYSETKSFVSMAIGILWGEGKIDLQAPILSYFPEYAPADPWLAAQTVKDMLCMQTVNGYDNGKWFKDPEPSRTALYFEKGKSRHPAGMVWAYDSAGSQVLSALAEKIAGKSLFAFLKERVFDKLGTFTHAKILKTKTEDSWGDSAMICTARDIASFGRLLMQDGKWNGEQLIPAQYVRTATSPLVCNDTEGDGNCFRRGYGYQVWHTYENGFAFVGMGDQLTVCLKDRDILLVTMADDQHFRTARDVLIDGFFDRVVWEMSDKPLPKNPKAYESLLKASKGELRFLEGNYSSPAEKGVVGKTYVCRSNPAGMTSFSLHLTKDENGNNRGGELRYENAQGKKVLPFGFGRNVFGFFPQFGYSKDHGGLPAGGDFTYRCATSAVFPDPDKLMIKCQIVDEYLGNVTFLFCFKDEECLISMHKYAEAFLDEYQGEFLARQQ
ncbi:MAG: beta-lactamase family protein [Clostridia bacterium]|nr:beta-lactamase family protein [Clostridia bacterium]